MVRVVLGGEGLAGFTAGEFTDHYVKLLFAPEGVRYPEPFDMQAVQESRPREEWPRMRTYTVRRWDAESRELTLDVVVHGDEGLAGPWAMRVQPGDTVHFIGPGGAYAPSVDADWHLMVGDESALPAIAASLEALPPGVAVHAFVEVSGPEEEQKADHVTWLHRGDRVVGELLVEAVRGLEFPAGRVHAFVHGEATFVKEIRRLLFVDRQVPRDQVSISGYWRLGHNEDRWQATKREWNSQVEAEQDA